MASALVYRLVGVILLGCLLSTVSVAQYRFDGSGRLLLPPPETMTVGQPISITVTPTKADAALYFREMVLRMDKTLVALNKPATFDSYVQRGVNDSLLTVVRMEIGCWLKNMPEWMRTPLKSNLSHYNCSGLRLTSYLSSQQDWLNELYTVSLFVEHPARKDSAVYPIRYNATRVAFENTSIPTNTYPDATQILRYDLRLQHPVNSLINRQIRATEASGFQLPDPVDVAEIVKSLAAWETDYQTHIKGVPQGFTPADNQQLAAIDKEIRNPLNQLFNNQYCYLADMISRLRPGVRDYYESVRLGFKPFVNFYSNNRYGELALRWLWYTGGTLTAHPFTTATVPARAVLDKQIQTLSDALVSLRTCWGIIFGEAVKCVVA